jgi:hypothetical protein
MGIRRHQSWTGVTKYFQQDEGALPSHDMTIIQSVSYRDRSLSRERTHMDLEDPNGVSEGGIGLPTPLDDRRRDSTWSEEFL